MSNGAGWLRLSGAGSALLPLEAVRELAPAGPITRLPGAPPEVLGLATVRGEVLTVVDVGDLAAASPVRCLAVVEARGARFALALDGVPRPGAHESGAPVPGGTTDRPLDVEALAERLFDLAALEGGPHPLTREEP